MSTGQRRTWMLGVIGVWLCLDGSVGRGAQMVARLEPETIYYGGAPSMLQVEVQGDSSGTWPTVENVEGLRISRYGAPSQQLGIFGSDVRRLYRFLFLINPTRPGAFQIPSVKLKVGEQDLTQGPFTLRVEEVTLKCIAAKLDPLETLVGQPATLAVWFQGRRPGRKPVLPKIDGLSIEPIGEPRMETSRQEGMPLTICQFQVTPARLGTFNVTGITLDGVAADAVTLSALPFVILGTRVNDQALQVGEQTTIQIVTRGLSANSGLMPVAPPGLKIVRLGQPSDEAPGTTAFTFTVTATEPGTPTIDAVKLADGRRAPLKQPVSFSVRQAGEGGILSFTGKARSDETSLGEPFIIDFDVFFRGDFQGAAVDPSDAAFADKPYVKVEPLNDLSYPDWSGQPLQIRFGPQGRLTALLGSGEFNGQKEQRIRFALRITPLAAGELSLSGLRVVVQLQITQQQRTGGFFSMSTLSQRYDSVAELPPHRVLDPHGKKAPGGYRGAVGTKFAFVTELDRNTAAAMSPLTLTMKITGETVSPEFQPPALTEVPELTRAFDVSPTTSGGEVKDKTITFTQVIRPRNESVRELPALPLVFYNYQKQQYETVYSLPIPIEVRAGSVVGAQAMQTTAGTQPTSAPAIVAGTADAPTVSLGSNYTVLGDRVQPEPLSPTELLALLIGGPLLVLLISVGSRVYLARRPGYELRHQRRQLIDGLTDLAAGDDFFVRLADLLQSYLRLRFQLPPGELHALLLDDALGRHGVSSELIRETQDLLSRCDAGRFATGQVADYERAALMKRAAELCARFERGAA